jgi:hypothetical protein
MRRALLFLLAAAAVNGQTVSATKTEHLDFPANGLLKVDNPSGELTIEAWDQPGVEITTTRSARSQTELDAIVIKSERKGDELDITTTWSRHRFEFRQFDLEYRIKVPRDTKLSIHQTRGEIHIDGVTADVDAKMYDGEITLHLPQDAKYTIDARTTKVGHIDSDYGGDQKHRWWGTSHFLSTPDGAPHKLHLGISYGDIVILKTNVPAPLP